MTVRYRAHGAALVLLAVLLAACSRTPSRQPAPRGTPAAAAATVATGAAGATPPPATAQDWPVYAHDPQRTGVNDAETAISPATAGMLQRQWVQTLPDLVGGSPISLGAVPLADGSRADLLYLTTAHGSTLAVNAASGALVWRQDTRGPQVANQPCQVCATPAADPSRQWVYAAGNGGAVHRYAAGSGQEDTTSPWPVPVTLLNGYEKRSSALNVANGYLYVALSGYLGDFGPYVGHVVAIHLPDGAAHVFNVLCSDQHELLAGGGSAVGGQPSCPRRQAGVWARAGVVVDQSGGPTGGSLYLASGNGPFDANAGGVDYGDSVLRLSGDVATLLDSYTPANYQELDQRDIDVGSTAPALLPPQPRSRTPYLAVQGGKDQMLRLLDRTHLGGVGSGLQTIDLGQGQILTSPAVWHDAGAADAGGDNDWIFVVTARVTVAYRAVTDGVGLTRLQEGWRIAQGGSSPVLAGGVLFLAGARGITANDPHTGRQLWSSAQPSAGGNVGGVHWQTPIVVDGRLCLADQSGRLACYALPAR